jgi:hypothetical protein
MVKELLMICLIVMMMMLLVNMQAPYEPAAEPVAESERPHSMIENYIEGQHMFYEGLMKKLLGGD